MTIKNQFYKNKDRIALLQICVRFQLPFITEWNEWVNFWNFFSITIICIGQQHHTPKGHIHTPKKQHVPDPSCKFINDMVSTDITRQITWQMWWLSPSLIADNKSQLFKCRLFYNHRIPILQWYWHILMLLAMLYLDIQPLECLVPSIIPPLTSTFSCICCDKFIYLWLQRGTNVLEGMLPPSL
jgi:hypothetical protein